MYVDFPRFLLFQWYFGPTPHNLHTTSVVKNWPKFTLGYGDAVRRPKTENGEVGSFGALYLVVGCVSFAAVVRAPMWQ